MERRSRGRLPEREVVESMVGFAGFQRRGGPMSADGLLKVTQTQRPDDSGYLTLTFILDVEGRDHSGRQLDLLNESTMLAVLGPRFEMSMDLPLRGRAPGSSYWIEEIDLFFRPLDPFPVPFVSEVLLPLIAEQLQLEFEPLTDWVAHPLFLEDRSPPSLWQRCLRWLHLAQAER